MRRRFASWVLDSPRTVIAAFAVVTLAVGAGAAKIRIVDDLTEVVPKTSPVKLAMHDLEERFGAVDTLVVMVQNPQGELFAPAVLEEVAALTERLQAARPIERVMGLATLNHYSRGDDGSLQAAPILPPAPIAATEAAAVAGIVAADPDLRETFVGAAGQSTVLFVDPKPGAADGDVLAALDEALAPTRALGLGVHTTGMSIVRAATTRSIRADMLLLVPIVVLVLLVILAITFRTISGVVLTMVLVSSAILPGAGLMGWFGVPMTAVNNTFPVLILAIACAGAIHILSIYYTRIRAGADRREAVRNVVEELALPVFLASATTAAGFLSLLSSPIPPIGVLGWVVAVGVLWAWLLTTLALPAALSLLPAPKHRLERAGGIGGFLETLANVPLRHRWSLLALVLATSAVLVGGGLPRIERETRVERFFFADEPARIDAEAIDEAFRGSTPLELIVHESVHDTDALRRVHAFGSAAQQLGSVGSVNSIVNILVRMQEAFTGERGIPDDPSQVAQALFLYNMSVAPAQYQRFVATDEQSFRVTVRMPNLPPDELEATIAELRGLMAEHLAGLDVSMTGKALFLAELNELVVRSTLRSVAFSLLVVFLMCWLSFRSFLEGLEGMAPLVVAVLGVFGIMGMVGIPLTIASALVSAIVIGVGVDYGVHVLARWDLLKGRPHDDRVQETLAEVGYPILLNALAVGCGLGVLAFSRFQPIRQLGLLAVAAMAAAAFGALLLIPLIKTLRAKGGA